MNIEVKRLARAFAIVGVAALILVGAVGLALVTPALFFGLFLLCCFLLVVWVVYEALDRNHHDGGWL